ncbi:hypothetical protein SCLCIDRAFT_27280 [Scleroderma citrinum Foug A]|uniref:Uncharacterized protein n=1 Tax=Scleroderma citrinum Foug A TaxID=1036808 RepID=A0A0C2ZC86_9AGAM|nr:hypothetical protein SCLCIDRAFT_27280 [Scleroderma citrinum Foug A]
MEVALDAQHDCPALSHAVLHFLDSLTAISTALAPVFMGRMLSYKNISDLPGTVVERAREQDCSGPAD